MEEESVIKLEDRPIEIKQPEEQKEKRMRKNEDTLVVICGSIKHTTTHIMGEKKERGRSRKGIGRNNDSYILKLIKNKLYI